jgi:predicted peptidase
MIPFLLAVALQEPIPHAPALPPDGYSIVRQIPQTIRFLVYVPKDYKQRRREKFPLILFLHGSGERGTDLNDVRRHGPPKEVAAGRDLPFVIVSPQCEPGKGWDPDLLSGLLDDIEKKYRIDKEREYLTGLSMGGGGTWRLAMAQPNRFAAIAPIAGFGDPANVAILKDVPVWATHGDSDPSVPIAEEQRMVDALKAAGGDVRFDIIPGGQHDVWSDVYKKDDLFNWFLTHRLHHSSVSRINPE